MDDPIGIPLALDRMIMMVRKKQKRSVKPVCGDVCPASFPIPIADSRVFSARRAVKYELEFLHMARRGHFGV